MFSVVRTAQMSRSRVTIDEPWTTPANPPITTKLTPESTSSRSNSLKLCIARATDPVEFHDQRQRLIVLPNTLFRIKPQVLFHETQIKAGAFRFGYGIFRLVRHFRRSES